MCNALKEELPLSDKAYQTVISSRKTIQAILNGEDPRLLVVREERAVGRVERVGAGRLEDQDLAGAREEGVLASVPARRPVVVGHVRRRRCALLANEQAQLEVRAGDIRTAGRGTAVEISVSRPAADRIATGHGTSTPNHAGHARILQRSRLFGD